MLMLMLHVLWYTYLLTEAGPDSPANVACVFDQLCSNSVFFHSCRKQHSLYGCP